MSSPDDRFTATLSQLRPREFADRRPGRLSLRVADDSGTRELSVQGPRIRGGAHPDNQIVVVDEAICAVHLELAVHERGVALRDLGSKNGTWVSPGVRVAEVWLQPGASFHAGGCSVTLVGLDDVAVPIATTGRFGELRGRSAKMGELFARLQRLAELPLDVLLIGETGTGKNPPPPPPPPGKDPTHIDPPTEVWAVHLQCSHDSHKSRHQVRRSLEGKDFIQVVPGYSGDVLTVTTTPEEPVQWKFDGRVGTGEWSFTVPSVALSDPMPWDLIGRDPVVRKLTATVDGEERTCDIEAFPYEKFDASLEPYRELIRDKVWAVPIWAIEKAAEILGKAGAFELKVLEKKDFVGELAMGWREHKGDAPGRPGYKAFLGFDFVFKATPLFQNNVEMGLSVGTLAKKWKWLDKILSKLPARLRKVIESIKLEAQSDMNATIKQELHVDSPGWPIPRLGPKPDKPAEFEGSWACTYTAALDASKALDMKILGELGSFKISLSIGFTFTFGLILDVEDEKHIGAYVSGNFDGIEVYGEVGLPGGIAYGREFLVEPEPLDPQRATISIEKLT